MKCTECKLTLWTTSYVFVWDIHKWPTQLCMDMSFFLIHTYLYMHTHAHTHHNCGYCKAPAPEPLFPLLWLWCATIKQAYQRLFLIHSMWEQSSYWSHLNWISRSVGKDECLTELINRLSACLCCWVTYNHMNISFRSLQSIDAVFLRLGVTQQKHIFLH